MPFQKQKSILRKNKDLIEESLYKLNKHKGIWYTSPRCGWCIKQKEILKSMDHRFLNLVNEDMKDIPEEIKGFPTLCIHNDKDGKKQFYPGLQKKEQIIKITQSL